MENTVSNDTTTCRFCSEEIPANFRICPFCKEPVNNTLSPEDYANILDGFAQELDRITGDPAVPEMDRKHFGKLLTVRTVVAASFTILTILMIVFGAAGRDMEALMIFGIIFFVVFGISLLVAFVNDYKSRVKENETPEKAFSSFMKAIMTNRSERAFIRIAPNNREVDPALPPVLEKVKVTPGSYCIRDVKSMQKYWSSFIRASGGYARNCKLGKPCVVSTNGDRFALVEASIEITSYSSMLYLLILINLIVCFIVILIVQKKEKLKFHKLLVKSNGRWYMAEGEFSGTLDKIPSVDNLIA